MAHISESAVCLRITRDDLDPKEITRLLGCSPTRSCVKGDAVNIRNTGRERIEKIGCWAIDVERSCPENIDRQVNQIFTQLCADLSVWGAIAKTCDIYLFCGLFMDKGNEGMDISPLTLTSIGERGIRMGLDIYGPYDGGPTYDDPCPCESGKIYGECCAKSNKA